MGFGIKSKIKKFPIINRYFYLRFIYDYYRNEHHDISRKIFISEKYKKTHFINYSNNKYDQICKAISCVDITPVSNNTFFYSVDPYTHVDLKYQILDNYSIDYSWVVNSTAPNSLCLINKYESGENYRKIVNRLKTYVDNLKINQCIIKDFRSSIDEISSIFIRPAEHFHEAIQRILFINQWLWQTGHKHNGFGHLDWILYDLYRKDIKTEYITKEDAKQYIKDFFLVLHDKCWFKSTMLLGDTGQIIILGGIDKDGNYRCNELTYLFIEVSKELKLPDPKVLLRVSKSMPDDLLRSAIECIATGIGAPFLSNDDVVIPSLLQFGYETEDAYDYAASACWEPLTIGKSCDQNNIRTINFCKPFVDFLDSVDFEKCKNIEEIKIGYYDFLSDYIDRVLYELDQKLFEEDPLLTLFNPDILKTGKDVVRGGAKYANLGLTSVGLSTVVNSLLNLKLFVFDLNQFTLSEINDIRKKNFEGYEEVRIQLDNNIDTFGKDKRYIIDLTNELMDHAARAFHKHHTKLGGDYKFGLSSPNYIVDAKNTEATFDGRKAGQPFGVHISGKNGLAPTELISFASQLDYGDNRINGNVVDFIMSPAFLKDNLDKAVTMIRGGILQGFYQLQINVVDSKMLIEAQNHPELFPNLVVRVWGFSAYFKDLPKDYQDNLIKRTIEAERAY